MSPLLLAWAAEAGIVTYRSFRNQHSPPVPGDFVATFVLFGVLGAVAEIPAARSGATLTGWGIVLATVLNLGPFGSGAVAGGPSLAGSSASFMPPPATPVSSPSPAGTVRRV